ncbi:MAG: thioredoxin domain-containing protein [Tissierellia bacterium]|nr:thioredoxin domain-containing protein [Tissierellia bacterium]
MTTTNKIPNKLINEKSPYLLQHAYNPVNWYPWSEEAFEKAKKEGKPIFLSIGYSTCHWCHVMAHESFEDDDVAKVLNRHFVSIKVDREERPDIDSVYMNVAQRITGHGGWPLTIIMTHEQKPFFAGTYFPKESTYYTKGLMEILNIVKNKWNDNQEELLLSSNQITDFIKQEKKQKDKTKLSIENIYDAKDIFEKNFDSKYGGFSDSPKFPQQSNLMFLMRYYDLEKDDKILEMIEKTLDSMYKGGIYDHVGFGFSRYSTDGKWLVPHFEKMLYDNAQLIIVYTESYLITKKPLYRKIAENTIEYVLREMTHEEGGFYSAQDADSEGEEGKYYVFTPDEILNLLGEVDGKFFNDHFNITKRGNFEGKSIPNLIKNNDYEVENPRIETLLPKVYDYRLTRTSLHKDDKILTSWNGMMIAALAIAYKAFGNEKYLNAAESALRFIKKKLINDNNKIAARYREEQVLENGTLDDYAFYVWALIEMYESTFETHYLKRAIKFNEKMIKLFWDDEKNGFYMTSNDSENLIYRPKEAYDGAIPSGNSVASFNLVRLSRLTGDINIEGMSNKQIEFLANFIEDYPPGYTFSLISLIYKLYSSKEIVCVAKDKEAIKDFQNIINNKFLVNTSVIALCKNEIEELSEVVPFIKGYDLKDSKTTYYICENKECSLPFTNINELIKAL